MHSESIAQFWQWFAANRRPLVADSDPPPELLPQIGARIRTIHPGLSWELELDGSPRKFIVSAQGDVELFPLVREVVDRAPGFTDISIIAFRQPNPGDVAIEIGGQRISAYSLWFSTRLTAAGLELTLAVPGIGGEDSEMLAQAAMVLVDNALGEYFPAMGVAKFCLVPMPPTPETEGLRPYCQIHELIAG